MSTLPGPVRRAIQRDDLLHLAGEADVAVGIVRSREHLLRDDEREAGVFSVALSQHLSGTTSPEWASRSQAWFYAATLLSFCEYVSDPLVCENQPTWMFARAADELKSDIPWESDLDHDLTLGVFTTYRRARHMRINGQYESAMALVSVPLESLFKAGAEPHWGLYMYEYAMCLLLTGRASEVPATLADKCAEWAAKGQPNCPTRHRLDAAIALAHWTLGEREQARQRFALARTGLLAVTAEQRELRGDRPGSGSTRIRLNAESSELSHLSLAQSLAECTAESASDDRAASEARDLGCLALEITERIRGRWRVIARSQTPLSAVFRRIYGDIALLACSIPGGVGAELGLQVALSAKQTGFAARIRQERLLMSPQLSSMLQEIADIEDPPLESLVATGDASVKSRLSRVTGWIAQTASTLLAETVLPEPASVAAIRELLGDRHAVDYVALPDTLIGERDNWFRSTLDPGAHTVEFEHFRPGAAFDAFFRSKDPWVDHLSDLTAESGPDWRLLAREILPATIIDTLQAATEASPVDLLISAHSELSLLPWAALQINEEGSRLVERAVLTQCPVLTCLTSTAPTSVEPPALVCLVPEQNLFLAAERRQWGLPPSSQNSVLHRCGWGADPEVTALTDDLASVLHRRAFDAELLHIASHGDGTGLEQRLFLPKPLLAAQALSLTWPSSVLMASCRVGRLHNPDDAEPLSFVMAMLTGGARCVVAAIDDINDAWVSGASADIISAIRRAPTRLDLELRRLQLKFARGDRGSYLDWALLTAYVR